VCPETDLHPIPYTQTESVTKVYMLYATHHFMTRIAWIRLIFSVSCFSFLLASLILDKGIFQGENWALLS
jgi:hypothetical protein